MNRLELISEIRRKKSFLCVGLDTDPNLLPKHFGNNPDKVLDFNKAIIEATSDLAVSYKVNTAFFEAMGNMGWELLMETFKLIPKDCLAIADAKRGDIGNTSNQYARAFFDEMGVDALTLAPYMGLDSIKPFMGRKGKWGIVLGLTSNPGSADFEQLRLESGEYLYEKVIGTIGSTFSDEELMFVVGATKPEQFKSIRLLVPNHFLLVPGVGAQGGSLSEVCKYGLSSDIGLLINASRSIIYASSGEDFADFARSEARKLQEEMLQYI